MYKCILILLACVVISVLLRIAREEGTGSVARKQALATNLLQKCKSIEEMVYFIRLLAVSYPLSLNSFHHVVNYCF
jgi:hypothetical protein